MDTRNSRFPLAVVGIGCRFPGGASTPEKFWQLMLDKKDAIIDVPKDRWDTRLFYDNDTRKPGKNKVLQAGFLEEDIKEFDPLFFDISPREADYIDPQQRLLLEVTYEAFEDAGLKISDITGKNIGVFAGGFHADFQNTVASLENIKHINASSASGVSMNMLANKISYYFNLTGPSLTIDTACSSSLVALHYAALSVWNAESEMAVVGGTNVLLNPSLFTIMEKGGYFSSHNRCKAFDDDAGGYVRGEGAGSIVLMPLDKAEEMNLQVYGSILSTGVNQDGKTPGIFVPSSDAQKALIKTVANSADIDLGDITYVEAHGTGTKVGDPKEISSINEAIARQGKRKNKLLVGSVKSNIGHLEGASGIAGLIKSLLVLQHKQVPPNIHFLSPRKEIDFDHSNVQVPIDTVDLPKSNNIKVAVNSFGFGGTNSHAVLGEYIPKTEMESGIEHGKQYGFLPISARSNESLIRTAHEYARFLSESDLSLQSFVSSCVHYRNDFEYRQLIQYYDRDDLIQKLLKIEPVSQMLASDVHPSSKKVLFVFSGMGPQWWGMARSLIESCDSFRATVEEISNEFYELAKISILDELLKSEAFSIVTRTDVAQFVNFAIQVAIVKLLKEYGVEPDAVVGHSVGEVSAAYVAGALSLKDAVLVSYVRGTAQHNVKQVGTMVALGVNRQQAEKILVDNHIDAEVAAENAEHSVTLSGSENELQKVLELFRGSSVFCRQLNVQKAFHSYHMDEAEQDIMEQLKSVEPSTEHLNLYSTVEGTKLNGTAFDANYWWKNVRLPVEFRQTVLNCINDGYSDFIEIGPHPVLKNSISSILSEKGFSKSSLFSTLNKKFDAEETFFEFMNSYYVGSGKINWNGFVEKQAYQRIPTYRFQQNRFWSSNYDYKKLSPKLLFLSHKRECTGYEWEMELNAYTYQELKDHVVDERVIFPAAAYLEIGFSINFYQNSKSSCLLNNLTVSSPLIVSDHDMIKLICRYDEDSSVYSVYSYNEITGIHTKHATGEIERRVVADIISDNEYSNLIQGLDECDYINQETIYGHLKQFDLNYSNSFRCIQRVYLCNNSVIGQVKLNDLDERFRVHPAIIDSGLQLLCFLIDGDLTYLPTEISEVSLYSSIGEEFLVMAKIVEDYFEYKVCNVAFFNASGKELLELKGVKVSLNFNQKQFDEDFYSSIYEHQWKVEEYKPIAKTLSTKKRWLVFEDVPGAANFILNDSQYKHIDLKLVHTFLNEGYDFAKNSRSLFSSLLRYEKFENIIIVVGGKSSMYTYDDVKELCFALNELIIGLVKNEMHIGMGVNLISISSSSGEENYALNSLWGVSRVISQEYPVIYMKMVAVNQSMTLDEKVLLLSELKELNRDEVRIDQNLRHVHYFLKKEKKDVLSGSYEEKECNINDMTLSMQKNNVILSVHSHKGDYKKNKYPVSVLYSALLVRDSINSALDYPHFVVGSLQLEEKCSNVIAIDKNIKSVSTRIDVERNGFVTLPESIELFPFTQSLVPYLMAYLVLKEIVQIQENQTLYIADTTSEFGQAVTHMARLCGAKIVEPSSLDKIDVLYVNGYVAIHKIKHRLAPFAKVVNLVDENRVSVSSRSFENCLIHNFNLEKCLLNDQLHICRVVENIVELIGAKKLPYLKSHNVSISNIEELKSYRGEKGSLRSLTITFENQSVLVRKKISSLTSSVKGCFVITGGLGAIGLSCAELLGENSDSTIVLLSRSGMARGDEAFKLEMLKAKGYDMVSYKADMSEQEPLFATLNAIESTYGIVRGVVHCAGITDDARMENLKEENYERVFEAKVKGTLYLDKYFDKHDLRFFVLISSISSSIGQFGQANYSAANAFLDSYSKRRRNQGKVSTLINLGPVFGAGLAKSDNVKKSLTNYGFKGLSLRLFKDCLEYLLCSNIESCILANLDWNVLAKGYDVENQMGKLRRAIGEYSDFVPTSLEESSVSYSEMEILEELVRICSETLSIKVEDLNIQNSLTSYGIDSISAMEIVNKINNQFRTTLNGMEVLSGPSIKVLSSLIKINLNIDENIEA